MECSYRLMHSSYNHEHMSRSDSIGQLAGVICVEAVNEGLEGRL